MPIRARTLARGALALFAATSFGAAYLVACSGDPGGAPPPGGESDATDAREDATSDAAPPPPPPTELSACRAYVLAFCERAAECGRSVSCEDFLAQCPDYLFSRGSARTIEGATACAAVRRQQPCNELWADLTPDCAPPGTLAVGEPCRFVAQCASFACDARGNGCGVCAELSSDGTCVENGSVVCPVNEQCVGGTCQPRRVPPQLATGAACSGESDAGVCPAGAPCRAGEPDAASGACQVLGDIGSPCRFALGSTFGMCREGTCSEGMCVAPRALDEPCGTTLGSCQPALYCARRMDGQSRCSPRVPIGERCDRPFAGAGLMGCASGGVCVEGRLPDGGVGEARCRGPRRAIGESCDPVRSPCAVSAVCNDAGVCEHPACPNEGG